MSRRIEPAACAETLPSEGQDTLERPLVGTDLAEAEPEHAARARSICAARRRRAELLPELSDLFHDPAWELLVDLYLSADRSLAISVSSACIGSAVPLTTALRVINVFEARGVVEVELDRFDKRRRFVRLSPPFRQKMADLLSAI